MKQFNFWKTKEVLCVNETLRRFTFRTVTLRDSYALLAVQNRQLAMSLAILRAESAHFRKKDCFECLSPVPRLRGLHETAV